MNLQAPDKILDKHLGILGINGSGKSYTAKGFAERLMDSGQRICIIDPTGVYWGLKSSTTGKRGGYPVVIFGGPHADLQISGSHGEAIAEAIGTSSTSAIIDTSLMRVGERTKFFADFAETLRIKNTGPLNLFIDEAHLFMPQGRVADHRNRRTCCTPQTI
jgi:DNA helicase HerA-like ATPase